MERPGWHGSRWTTSGSFSHSGQDIFRGFLSTIADVQNNAIGFREKIDLLDLYANTHFIWPLRPGWRVVLGGDFLHGNGDADGATFTYFAPLSGTPDPAVAEPTDLNLHLEDRREFFGGYALAESDATPRLRLTGGIRLNVTFEKAAKVLRRPAHTTKG
jgi:hypothetical protein